MLVVHDEGDFDLGRLQARKGGGLGGHNGLRSIAQALGTQDFMRLRIGVGRPERGDRRSLADYVLCELRAARRRRDDRRARGRGRRDARRRRARADAAPLQLNLTPARRPPRHASWSGMSNNAPFCSRSCANCCEHEKLQEFAESLPTRARVSEPALPLVVSALHEQLGRALTILVPEDADARDLAEAAAGTSGRSASPSCRAAASAGTRARPPPHLVGERARALHLLEQGGLVVVSASAAAEGLPPPARAAGAASHRAGRRAGHRRR